MAWRVTKGNCLGTLESGLVDRSGEWPGEWPGKWPGKWPQEGPGDKAGVSKLQHTSGT